MRRASPARGSVVIAGAVARRPGRGGHAWVFLQYVLGFRRLGWDVLWLDSIDAGAEASSEADVREYGRFCSFADIEGDAALLSNASSPRPTGETVRGLDRRSVVERVAAADLFINVMGYIRDEEILGAARRRLFLDIDPGFGQMWEDLGLARMFAGHDAYATVGLRVGEPDCLVPSLGIDWIVTPPPVVLAEFEPDTRAGSGWSSVCSWRGPFAPVEHGGRTYGLRVHEFRRVLDLPRRTGAPLRLALDIDEADRADRDRLVDAGWELLDPLATAGDPRSYRRFVRESTGEIMVAKGLYVHTRSGWFSDRSVCYLAAGRPVVAQDTGWSEAFRADEGLLDFADVDGAAAAIEAVQRAPDRHRRAARAVAEAHFDSDRVLTALAERAA